MYFQACFQGSKNQKTGPKASKKRHKSTPKCIKKMISVNNCFLQYFPCRNLEFGAPNVEILCQKLRKTMTWSQAWSQIGSRNHPKMGGTDSFNCIEKSKIPIHVFWKYWSVFKISQELIRPTSRIFRHKAFHFVRLLRFWCFPKYYFAKIMW